MTRHDDWDLATGRRLSDPVQPAEEWERDIDPALLRLNMLLGGMRSRDEIRLAMALRGERRARRGGTRLLGRELFGVRPTCRLMRQPV